MLKVGAMDIVTHFFSLRGNLDFGDILALQIK